MELRLVNCLTPPVFKIPAVKYPVAWPILSLLDREKAKNPIEMEDRLGHRTLISQDLRA